MLSNHHTQAVVMRMSQCVVQVGNDATLYSILCYHCVCRCMMVQLGRTSHAVNKDIAS